MSDYFLNKIYNSILTKTPIAKKTLIKENKTLNSPSTLQQAYQVTLKKINEKTDVLMQQKGSDNVEEFSISDELARKIKSSIKKETGFEGAEIKTNLNEIIKNALTVGGWSRTAKFNFLVESVSNIFDKEDLNIDNIIKYSSILQNIKTSPFEENLVNKPQTKVELKNLIPDWFHSFFESRDGYNVVNELWGLIPDTKPATGSGELIFSLISNAKKAQQGDILLNGKHIEIKGINGTMGADGQVLNTGADLKKLLQDDLVDISMSNRRRELVKRLNELPSKYEDFKKNIIQQVQSNVPFDIIKKTIDTSSLTDRSKEWLYKTLIASLTIPEFNFRDALLAFFSKYEILSEDQLAAGVFAARNYKNITSPEDVQNKIKNIIISDKNLLFQKQHERLFTKNMIALIAALHLCCYQEKEKFKGIIFANDTNKNMVYFNFNGDTVSQNLDSAYAFILQFNPGISLSMSKIQKAASFTFFK